MTDNIDGIVRFYQKRVFLSIFIGYSLYILCRKSFSFVIPYIQHEEHLSKEDLGKIVSALNLAYAISKFAFGILSDNVGATLLFCSGLITTSASVLGFAFVKDVKMFTLLWFLNGMGQGCGWPACSKLLRKWFQKEQFGTWWSILSASMNITGVITPIFLQFFTLSNGGWRSFMFFCGILSIAWASLCVFTVIESPEIVGLPSFSDNNPNSAAAKKKKDDNLVGAKKSTLSDLIYSPFLWLLSFYNLIFFAAKTSFENWIQLLIVDEKALTAGHAVAFISAFETGGMIGNFATGYLTDICVSKMPNSKSSPRMIVVLVYMVASVLALQTLTTSNAALPLVAFVLGCSLYGNINLFGLLATESAPVYLSGTSHSIVSLTANIGAVIAGYPFSVLAHSYGWLGVFTLLEIGCAACLILALVTKNFCTKIGVSSVKED
uniref:Major facilitator superfamily (MFS) profile domain-containing protein n=1 Tax=Romanomermis culicivorax TaxID=13658 RepID=A0A915HHT6_ROMCU